MNGTSTTVRVKREQRTGGGGGKCREVQEDERTEEKERERGAGGEELSMRADLSWKMSGTARAKMAAQ